MNRNGRSGRGARHPLTLLRQAHGLTLKGLDERSGVHFTQLSRIEHGLEPSPRQLEKIAAAFGVIPDNLARTLEGR
jgi:transcriptional regulator with XRE-family HTH domain